jgi:hypothetical protein
MGISDEDYANALEHQKLHKKALMKLEVQNKQESLEQAIRNSITYTTTTGSGVSLNNVAHPYGIFNVLLEKDLNHEAMKAPLSSLIDMWLARWQGDWVSETNFQEDDFWRITLVRLTGANKLEKHNLANQMSPVYRIIE